MDKNQVTGLVLISALLMVYMWFFAPDPADLPQEPIATEQVEQPNESSIEATEEKEEVVESDSVLNAQFGVFAAGMKGEGKTVELENQDVIITFNTKGGTVERVILKNYVTFEKKTLILLDKTSSSIDEVLPTRFGDIHLNDLFYQVNQTENSLSFQLVDASGEVKMERIYTLPESGFVLDYDLKLEGIRNELNGQSLAFSWKNEMKRLELALQESRYETTVNYYTIDDNFDYLSERSTDLEEETLEQPAKWVSMKQKFFNSSIITDQQFDNVYVATNFNEKDSSTVKYAEMQLEIPLTFLQSESANLRYYFGPNDYDICETVTERFEENVDLGWGLFNVINRFTIIPLFKALESVISNYGIIILVLVLIVKSVLFPLTYRSYVSMAKMKVLKPEIDEIKERVGEDQMKMQQETMKLYGQFGVSPLSGCIPMLAQMPIFLALFNFFPNAIQLRQEEFLWATDLSTYDSIATLPFSIPFYGDHVSLFTLLMTISTIIYTYYNNQLNSAQMQGPMKSIGYVMPVMFMFALNSFSSGLTYYYFVSNVITISQQILIKNFIVDEKKIRATLDANKDKNKNKKKSKLRQRLDNAMKAAQEQQELRRGGTSKKEVAQKVQELPDFSDQVSGKINVLDSNGNGSTETMIEVVITNNSEKNLQIEYDSPTVGKRKVNVASQKTKKQRFKAKSPRKQDLKIDILNAFAQ